MEKLAEDSGSSRSMLMVRQLTAAMLTKNIQSWGKVALGLKVLHVSKQKDKYT